MSERRAASSGPPVDGRAVDGRSIILVSWVAVGLFAVTIVPDAAGLHALDGVAAGVALALFLVSLPVWLYAFGLAVVRSARGDDIGVGSLFFLVGSAPADVRRRLFGALAVAMVLALATAWANAFAALEPMLQLALVGVWSARHGTFAARDLAPAPGARSRPRQVGSR